MPQYLANSPTGLAVPNDTAWGAAAPVVLGDAATVTPNFSLGIDFVWTLAGAGRALANPLNIKPGQKGHLYLVQDSTGGRTITSWDTFYKFAGAIVPTLTTAANALDTIIYAAKSTSEILCWFTPDMRSASGVVGVGGDGTMDFSNPNDSGLFVLLDDY